MGLHLYIANVTFESDCGLCFDDIMLYKLMHALHDYILWIWTMSMDYKNEHEHVHEYALYLWLTSWWDFISVSGGTGLYLYISQVNS